MEIKILDCLLVGLVIFINVLLVSVINTLLTGEQFDVIFNLTLGFYTIGIGFYIMLSRLLDKVL